MDADEDALVGWLERAQVRGHVGPGDVRAHIVHAARFVDALEPLVAAATDGVDGVDLGTGAGVPGLVLALHWPATTWTLIDGRANRAADLEQAVRELGLSDRVTVLGARAE